MDETLIRMGLRNLNRKQFQVLFCMDSATLVKGGEMIVDTQGEISQLLFASTSGLDGIATKLADARDAAQEFYKYRAKSGRLIALKNQLTQLKIEREQIDVSASDYKRLRECEAEARRLYQDAFEQQSSLERALAEIERRRLLVPRWREMIEAQKKLEAIGPISIPAKSAVEDTENLRIQIFDFRSTLNRFERSLADRRIDLAELEINESVRSCETHLSSLRALKVKYEGAQADIPKRIADIAESDRQIKDILQKLEKIDAAPETLLFKSSKVAEIRDLIQSQSGVFGAVETARHEFEEAKELASIAAESFGSVSLEGSLLEVDPELAALVAQVNLEAPHVKLQSSRDACVDVARRLSDAINELAPWDGTSDALAHVVCPDKQAIVVWQTQLQAFQTASTITRDKIKAAERDLVIIQARLSARREEGLVSEDEIRAMLEKREEAWREHRKVLSAGTADAFEICMHRYDRAFQQQVRHATSLATFYEDRRKLAELEAGLEILRNDLIAERKAHDSLIEVIRTSLSTISPFFANWTLSEFETWDRKRTRAIGALDEYRSAERAVEKQKASVDALALRLKQALDRSAVGYSPDADLLTLVAHSAAIIQRRKVADEAARELKEHRAAQSRREDRLKATINEKKKWTLNWTAAFADTWLSDIDPNPGIDRAKDILDLLALLDRQIGKKVEAERRLAGMQEDGLALTKLVDNLAPKLGLSRGEKNPIEMAEIVDVAVAAELNKAMRAESLRGDIEKIEKSLQENNDSLRQSLEKAQHWFDYFGCKEIEAAASKAKEAEEARALQTLEKKCAGEIIEGLVASSIEEAIERLAQLDIDELSKEEDDLKSQLGPLKAHVFSLYSEAVEARKKLEATAGSGRVAAIEEQRRTIILEIEEEAGDYIRLRAGVLAAEHALREFRDKHRSSMLRRASDTFNRITCSAYSGLATQPVKDRDSLVALLAGGAGTRMTDQLSSGTRAQLYFALRIAGYHEFMQETSSVPFVADDVMETFDDARSLEAFRMLVEMSKVGQVIYLTHHEHMAELARIAHPAVRIHRLSSRTV